MAKKIKILFVDDEPNVLTSLRRMLRSKADTWDMHFVESGQAALDLLGTKEMDVIVSDVRMPGMGGSELFNRVKKLYPETIRLALSGQVDLTDVISSAQAVHQYISKPCSAEMLVRKIENALYSQSFLTDPKLVKLISEVESLPVVPKVLQDIQAELAKKEPSIQTVAEAISHDVGMAAKILNLINSPYFGLPAKVDTLTKAITLLGLDTIRTLVLFSHLFEIYDTKKVPGFSLNLLWDHCFRVSNIARLIAECEKMSSQVVSDCRMAGLLHDVGKLILATYFPKKYSEIIAAVKEQGGTINQIEERVLGASHAKIGAYLMGLWGVKDEIIHGIGFHHEHDELDMSVTMFLSVANVIDHNLVVIHADYAKARMSQSLAPLLGKAGLGEKWIKHINTHWCSMDEQCDLGEQELMQLFQ